MGLARLLGGPHELGDVRDFQTWAANAVEGRWLPTRGIGPRAQPVAARVGLASGAGVRKIVTVGLDLFLAHVFADGLLLGYGFLLRPDPLHRDGFLLHDGTFLVQGDFVIVFAERLVSLA